MSDGTLAFATETTSSVCLAQSRSNFAGQLRASGDGQPSSTSSHEMLPAKQAGCVTRLSVAKLQLTGAFNLIAGRVKFIGNAPEASQPAS